MPDLNAARITLTLRTRGNGILYYTLGGHEIRSRKPRTPKLTTRAERKRYRARWHTKREKGPSRTPSHAVQVLDILELEHPSYIKVRQAQRRITAWTSP